MAERWAVGLPRHSYVAATVRGKVVLLAIFRLFARKNTNSLIAATYECQVKVKFRDRIAAVTYGRHFFV